MRPINEPIRAHPIRITEVGPRDGLQNEPRLLSTEHKIAFINLLSRTGVAEIEVGSFASPNAVPQLAETDDVFRKIERIPGVIYSALVPNERGLERARAAAAQKIAVFTAASETFTQRNVHMSIDQSIERFKTVIKGAKRDGMAVRGYISTVVFCPYEGRIEPVRVLDLMKRLVDLGVDDVSLGETIGKASPPDMRRLLDAVLPAIEPDRVSLHVHDTYGMAIANVLTAWWDYGLTAFDSSAGGLGGCPSAPGASGNVATEDVVYALKASGASVAVDEWKVTEAARQISAYLGHPLVSRLSRFP
ncbi:MAG TPA: hydroxymethylglutaryl-CoA lyase [Nitrospiraceae bacterium]|nr:hydroxymethylglutaryl-CoA lyase [Nitrospiraceae bacterium]